MQILGRDIIVSMILMLLIMIVFIITNKDVKIKPLSIAGVMFLTLMMSIVFSLTGVSPLSGFHTDIRWNEVSWIPVKGTIDMIQSTLKVAREENVAGIEVALYLGANIIGNILMFCPLGFCLPLLWQKMRKFSNTILFGLGVSLLVEFSQLFLSRGTDVDDLILNTLGTAIGYVVYAVFRMIFFQTSRQFTMSKKIEKYSWRLLPLMCVEVPYVVIVVLGFYDRAII